MKIIQILIKSTTCK